MTTVIGVVVENATFECEKTTGYNGTIDPETNNPSPSKKTFRVDCYLAVSASKTRENPQPNLPPQLWAEGYVTRVIEKNNPLVELDQKLPVAIAQGHSITISGVQGKFYQEKVPISAELEEFELLDITGEPVYGWFEAGRL
jgi:hypothetical protein